MKNKKLLVGVLLATTLVATGYTYSFASFSSTGSTLTETGFRDKLFAEQGHGMGGKGGFGQKMGKGFMNNLTDEEKVLRESREVVMDKLLAGEKLSTQEETLRQEIIKQRAERKVEMQTRQAEMDAIKTIMDKKDAGQTLTTQEQTLLDTFHTNRHERHQK